VDKAVDKKWVCWAKEGIRAKFAKTLKISLKAIDLIATTL